MSYQLVTADDVFLVKWGNIESQDLPKVESEILSMHRKLGRDLLYIGVISLKSSIPSSDIRGEIGAAMKRLSKTCRDLYVVIEGNGLVAATIRTVSAGISLISGERVKFASSVEDVLRAAEVGPSTRNTVNEALKSLS